MPCWTISRGTSLGKIDEPAVTYICPERRRERVSREAGAGRWPIARAAFAAALAGSVEHAAGADDAAAERCLSGRELEVLALATAGAGTGSPVREPWPVDRGFHGSRSWKFPEIV